MAETATRSITRTIDQESMTRFAGQLGYRIPGFQRDVHNHHTDPEIARSIGLAGTVAQALQYCAYLSQLMLEEDGEAWLTRGEFEMKFFKPLLAGDEITVSIEGDGGSRHVECRNQHGELVAAGTAGFGG